VRGKTAERSCNIACYSTAECQGYVVGVDGKGRVRCFLKKCKWPLVASSTMNASLITQPPKLCRPGQAAVNFNLQYADGRCTQAQSRAREQHMRR
jgi:hypothetical protein